MFTQSITGTKMSLFTGYHIEKNRRCCDSKRCCAIATMDYGTAPTSSFVGPYRFIVFHEPTFRGPLSSIHLSIIPYRFLLSEGLPTFCYHLIIPYTDTKVHPIGLIIRSLGCTLSSAFILYRSTPFCDIANMFHITYLYSLPPDDLLFPVCHFCILT